MIKIKSKEDLEKVNLTARESATIQSSRKKFLIRVEDEIHLTNNWQRLVTENYPNVPSNIVEIYSLT